MTLPHMARMAGSAQERIRFMWPVVMTACVAGEYLRAPGPHPCGHTCSLPHDGSAPPPWLRDSEGGRAGRAGSGHRP